MNRKPYSAGAVKFSFWFIEFRKTVQLLAEGKSFSEIKLLNEQENIYSASTKARAQMIYSTVMSTWTPAAELLCRMWWTTSSTSTRTARHTE